MNNGVSMSIKKNKLLSKTLITSMAFVVFSNLSIAQSHLSGHSALCNHEFDQKKISRHIASIIEKNVLSSKQFGEEQATQQDLPELGRLVVEFDNLIGFNTDAKTKIYQAKSLIEDVINSDIFRAKVLGHTYQNKITFVQNNDMTNEQIYRYMMTGQEVGVKDADEAINLRLVLVKVPFYKFWLRNVIGWTNPGDPNIYMNSKFFWRFTTEQIAANMVHEWLHKMGFDHDFNGTARRPYSVPYSVGNMIEILGKEWRLGR